MAKLIDRLHELGRPLSTPIGFARQSVPQRVPAMLLAAELGPGEPASGDADSVMKGADAVLLKDLPGSEQTGKLDGVIWGARIGDASEKKLDQLKEAGCDFLFVESDSASAAVLRDDGMAKGFAMPLDVSEEQARALDGLPFDYLVLDYEIAPESLSISHLMRIQYAVSMVGKHVFLRASRCPSKAELELLRDAPVDAILVPVASDDTSRLDEARGLIDQLEPRKPRGRKGSPYIPHSTHADAGESDDGDGEDWDDDDW